MIDQNVKTQIKLLLNCPSPQNFERILLLVLEKASNLKERNLHLSYLLPILQGWDEFTQMSSELGEEFRDAEMPQPYYALIRGGCLDAFIEMKQFYWNRFPSIRNISTSFHFLTIGAWQEVLVSNSRFLRYLKIQEDTKKLSIRQCPELSDISTLGDVSFQTEEISIIGSSLCDFGTDAFKNSKIKHLEICKTDISTINLTGSMDVVSVHIEDCNNLISLLLPDSIKEVHLQDCPEVCVRIPHNSQCENLFLQNVAIKSSDLPRMPILTTLTIKKTPSIRETFKPLRDSKRFPILTSYEYRK